MTLKRSALTLVAAALAAATFTSPAFAGWESQDTDTGGSTPAGWGNAPHQPTNSGSATPCQYTVKGRLYVKDPTLDGVVNNDPLAGVEIKVSGADSWGSALGIFGEWKTTYTNANGEFSVTHDECHDRRVRVQAKFVSKSGDLRVLGPSSPEWYELKDTGHLVDNDEPIDLHGEPFGGETGDQATGQARTDAQTWVLYQRALDYADSIGRPFLNDVTVHNPASITVNDNSWTDPVLHDIRITPNAT